jgi:hypothetical protein
MLTLGLTGENWMVGLGHPSSTVHLAHGRYQEHQLKRVLFNYKRKRQKSVTSGFQQLVVKWQQAGDKSIPHASTISLHAVAIKHLNFSSHAIVGNDEGTTRRGSLTWNSVFDIQIMCSMEESPS